MIDLFNEIKPQNKAKILQFLESDTLTYNKGANILSSMKLGNNIVIVLDGYLQILRTDYNGNKFVIEELEEGAIFGSIISSINSNEYEVKVIENAKLLLIDFDHIINNDITIKGYDQFLKNLLLIINTKIEKNNERIIILTNKTIRDRLLEYFRLMSKKNNNSKIVYLPFSYISLADYLAVDRCSMSREMKHLKEEGLISVEGKKIKLLY